MPMAAGVVAIIGICICRAVGVVAIFGTLSVRLVHRCLGKGARETHRSATGCRGVVIVAQAERLERLDVPLATPTLSLGGPVSHLGRCYGSSLKNERCCKARE